MAALSSPGIGSGIDVNTLVPQLVALERRPIELLTQQTTTLQAKLSAFGLLQSYTVNVQDAVAKLAKPSFWTQTSATSSDAAAVTVASSSAAAIGSYTVEVSHLAQAHTLASRAYADATSAVGTGSLRIDFGAWNSDRTAFTAGVPAAGLDIAIGAGEDSLESVKAKINAANAGVSASIVKDATGARLVIRSTATGAERAMRITANADAPAVPGGPTLADLVYDPQGDLATDPDDLVPPAMTETVAAQNAKALLNGLPVESSTNTLADVSDGLSITVGKQTSGPVTVKVGLDTAAMKSAINDFVSAYNAINKYIAEQTKYDADKKAAATLQGDRSTLSLQEGLRAALRAANGGASTTLARLSDVGIQFKADGSLAVNDTRLAAAMSDMPALAEAFTRVDSVNPSNGGFAVRLQALTKSLVAGDGLIATRSQGLRATIARNDKQVDVLEDRVAAVRERLLRQYSALDLKMNQLTGLNAYVTQQIANWNKTKA
ncbi:MAG TPA: flagellar filament capping protein FliD [Albitalea sp.]